MAGWKKEKTDKPSRNILAVGCRPCQSFDTFPVDL